MPCDLLHRRTTMRKMRPQLTTIARGGAPDISENVADDCSGRARLMLYFRISKSSVLFFPFVAAQPDNSKQVRLLQTDRVPAISHDLLPPSRGQRRNSWAQVPSSVIPGQGTEVGLPGLPEAGNLEGGEHDEVIGQGPRRRNNRCRSVGPVHHRCISSNRLPRKRVLAYTRELCLSARCASRNP